MKTKRTKACVVEALFRTSFCTKTSTRFCTECGLALTNWLKIFSILTSSSSFWLQQIKGKNYLSWRKCKKFSKFESPFKSLLIPSEKFTITCTRTGSKTVFFRSVCYARYATKAGSLACENGSPNCLLVSRTKASCNVSVSMPVLAIQFLLKLPCSTLCDDLNIR